MCRAGNPLFSDDDQDEGRQDVIDPFQSQFWFEDRTLDSGARDYLDPEETLFWEQLIEV